MTARGLPGDEVPVEEHLTELGFAQRIVRLHGQDLRYWHPSKRWFVWDGVYWREDCTAETVRGGKATVATIYAEASRAQDDKARKAIADFAARCEAARRIMSALELAASEPGVPILPDELDAHHDLLTVPNGTIELRTGTLLDHDRDHLITKLAPVRFDPKAAAPTWDAFLERVVPDPQVREFLQRYAGYSITGSTQEQVLVVLWGGGANGKSTLLETLREAVGDYAQHAPADTIMAKRDTGIPNDVARLRGARFVSIVETEEGRRLAESQIKHLTGGDMITARYMRGEWFEFRPTAKFWLATNHRPQVRGTDYAIWRRIRLVPFQVQIPESERDPHLRDKLREELPGILRWMVDGAVAWHRDGLHAPQSVLAATEEYRAHEDLLGTWIADCCFVNPDVQAGATVLYDSFSKWCAENGESAMTQRAFGDRLTERGFENGRARTGRKVRKGIALAATADAGDER